MTEGRRTALGDLPEAHLHLLNHGDHTFAAVRTDEASLRTMLEGAGGLPDPLSRALAVSTAWDMLLKGELSSDEPAHLRPRRARTERSPGWSSPSWRWRGRPRSSGARPSRSRTARPGGRGRRRPWPRTPSPGAGAADAGRLRHRRAARRGPRGRRDHRRRPRLAGAGPPGRPGRPRPRGGRGAAGARPRPGRRGPGPGRHRRPRRRRRQGGGLGPDLPAARRCPPAHRSPSWRCFWRPVQHDLLLPWTQRYLDEVARLAAAAACWPSAAWSGRRCPDHGATRRSSSAAREVALSPTRTYRPCAHPAGRCRHPGARAAGARMRSRRVPAISYHGERASDPPTRPGSLGAPAGHPRRRPRRCSSDSSIGKRSSRCRSMAAPTRPANSGCGRVGRERSSGCACVET